MKGHLVDAKDGIRWHLKSRNGKLVAESGEAYTEERGAREMFVKLFPDYPLVLLDGSTVKPEGTSARVELAQPKPAKDNHPLATPLGIDGNK